MTYDGLGSCILNIHSYENESRASRGDGCATDSLDDEESICSSSKDAFGSFSSKWLTTKRDERCLDEWDLSESPQHFFIKDKPACAIQFSDVEAMKEKFSKLLLGEDITGGCKGLSTALALSNGISNLAATVFGELWKLEPLPEERKSKWRREMDWLLSPTNYMVELVPAKQNGANGRTLEIMTPKARADIHMNLPALQKLDSMLIETLDSMVNTEFWYAEGGSQAEGRSNSARQSKRWWLPSPQVPTKGLSDTERKKLLHQGRVSGKASLGEELYKVLSGESGSPEEMLNSLNLKSEHGALEAVNRLEAAAFAWRVKVAEQISGKSPVRTSWSFKKDPLSEMDKMELLLDRAEALLHHLKTSYPNLPHSFLDATKIQYGKDVGHSILEAYSRVLGNLADSILSRIKEILQEDCLSNPNSPVATRGFPDTNLCETSAVGLHARQSLIDQMNKVYGQHRCDSNSSSTSDSGFSSSDAKASSVSAATPGRSSRVWCMSREACTSSSPKNTP
ncbi:hypothetical protein I3760_12G046100 [Carya illinoinensis]|nr:hypothetical protein I3760_12G046100 [Carya illinoinensis]